MDNSNILIILSACVISIVIGLFAGITYRKKIAEKEIGGATNEASRILNDAIALAENKKREMLLEAKEEIHKNRTELDSEIRERRGQLSKIESRLTIKEETLESKLDGIDSKKEELSLKISKAEESLKKAEEIKSSQTQMLEKISGISKEEAKQSLIQTVERAAKLEASVKVKIINEQAKEEAETNARELITRAIQRIASDYVSESTVSVVNLPNDEMKGRIIGREGRNIRAIETLTGIDLIIDDTPEVITLSGFDAVRRDIAKIALENLIVDGRIHPTRIEEMVEKAKLQVEASIKADGESAVFELGLLNVHPEIIKTIGRMKYRTSYGQNILKHSIEVAHIAGILATEMGMDPTVAKRGALLHDLGKALDHDQEGSHVELGCAMARKYKESEAVVHAMEAHHGDVEMITLEAFIVQASDAISASRPGARRENIESYIKRLEKLEAIANETEGVERCFAIQAGREIRVIVKADEVAEQAMSLLTREIAQKIEAELQYPGQIKVQLIRETRSIDFAK